MHKIDKDFSKNSIFNCEILTISDCFWLICFLTHAAEQEKSLMSALAHPTEFEILL